MISYAQNFEDVILARLFEGQREGFYVDIGAAHPTELSVTRHFYDLGWSGINVEPIASCHALFERERPRDVNLNVAVGAAAGQATFHEATDNPAVSTMDPQQAAALHASGQRVATYTVPVVTADSIFESHGLDRRRVDFLKIDVEGAEAEVLRGLDLRRFRPRVLVVEAIASAGSFPGWAQLGTLRSMHEAWEPRVLEAGYRFAHFDGISRFYVADDQLDLLPRFAVPPGVYDDIVLARELDAGGVVAEREARIAERDAAIAERDAYLAHLKAAADPAGIAERDAYIASLKEQVKALEEGAAKLKADYDELEKVRAHTQGKLEYAWSRVVAHDRMTLRERFADMLVYSKRALRDRIFAGMWFFATGRTIESLPRITLVTPVLNGRAHIAETLESVLRQEYPNLEYIVVDGGSTDGTLDVIREYEARTDLPQRIARVVSEPDQGMYDAVAKGFAASQPEREITLKDNTKRKARIDEDVYGYLNADDLLEPGALEAVGRYFAVNPGVNAIFHEDAVLVNGWKYPNVRQPHRVTVDDLLRGHILFQDGVFYRRNLYEAAGGVRRDLKLAGDYALWLAMCSLSKFVRRDDHVSTFRIRGGQLSGDMARYNAEMARAREEFLRGKPASLVWRWRLVGMATRLRERLARRVDPLFYPLDFGNMPPPPANPPPLPDRDAPRSPIDRGYANRLLFSTVDTRFGDKSLNYIYYDSRNGVAISYPPIDPARLDALYRANYSNPPKQLGFPAGVSPFRHFDRRRFWQKVLFRFPIERFHRVVQLPSWEDNTLAELTVVLRESGIDPSRPLRVLDAGCFEGLLLDHIEERTTWSAAGLEPNEEAVAVAREKGHTVWHAKAEDALEVVPPERRFDLIYMGQSIEHVDDPVKVLCRLRLLLAPGGAIVCSTPNLDSKQVEWFGPTWAHWHPPYHRHIFSRRGVRALAAAAGLATLGLRTFSHPYWTSMTLAQKMLGLDGVVSHDVDFDMGTRIAAQRVDFWMKRLWNPLGRGDYTFIVMGEGERG